MGLLARAASIHSIRVCVFVAESYVFSVIMIATHALTLTHNWLTQKKNRFYAKENLRQHFVQVQVLLHTTLRRSRRISLYRRLTSYTNVSNYSNEKEETEERSANV